MIKKALVLFCSMLCLSGMAQAADLLSVYEMARAHDAQYQAALMKFRGDLLVLDMSRSRYRPNVSFTHRLAHNDYESDQLDVSRLDVSGCTDLACIVSRVNQLNNEGTDSSYESQQSALVLTQTIYDASLLADNKKAEAFSEKARQEMLDAEKELVMRVVAGYLAVLKAADEKRLIARQIDTVETLRILAEKRYQLGVGKEQEMLEAQAYHDAQTLALLAADASYQVALQQLQNITGQSPGELALLSANMPVAVLDGKTPVQWQQQSRQNNNAIQAAKALEQVNYFDLRSKKQAGIPKFNFAASYLDEQFSGGRGFSPESTVKAYGIEMKWPIYQGGGIAASSKQAAFRLQESQERLRQLEEGIDVMVLGLVLAIESDIKRYEAAQRLQQSSQALAAMAKKAYQNGAGDLLAWFDAEKKSAEAQQNMAMVRYDYIEHRLSLQRLSGDLSVKDVQAINDWLEK